MFLSLLSHWLCAWFAFVLPCYSTYKALVHSASADTLQALSTYWAVIGAFVAFEHTLGLFLSWLPFYWELRTIFLLYVSLPQTQGSVFVFNTCLEPWLSRNEPQLDAALASAQTSAIAFCRTRITALFDLVWTSLNKTPSSALSSPAGDAQKPAYSLPIPVDRLSGLWTTRWSSLLAALAPRDTSDVYVSSAKPEEVHKSHSAN